MSNHQPDEQEHPAAASPEAGVLFVHDPDLGQYYFGPDHPLQPRRHLLLMDLLEQSGILRADGPDILLQHEADRKSVV